MLKTLLMFGVAAAALGGAPAMADSFGYTGTLKFYPVDTTGVYDFTAAGGNGGANLFAAGGQGALLTGQVTLNSGAILGILVGQAGSTYYLGGGGGGGTFVFVQSPAGMTANTALIVAGGGGGSAFLQGDPADSSPTGAGHDPSNGLNSTVFGGDGQGGGGSIRGGAGGAGVSSDGGPSAGYFGGVTHGGSNPAQGDQGGASYYGSNGGFGGGGGGYSGGGGGFTGGDGGYSGYSGGGAGTSYLKNGVKLTSQDLNDSADGNGYFNIALESPAVSAAPEPATWLEMLMGVGAMGLLMRRAKRTAGLLPA